MNIAYLIEDRTIRLCDAGGDIFTIREDPTDTGVTVILTGMLRSDVVCYLQDELEALQSLGLSVTADLSGLDYMSSAAQQVFLQVQQKIDRTGKGTLKLLQPSDAVYAELVRSGASELLHIERGGN